MFGIGQTEFIIILVFAFLLFGPDKLPQAGKTIGRAIRQFRETQQKVTSVVQTEVIDPMAAAASASTPSKQAAIDEDADADTPADAAAKAPEARKETFAERRARLAAEKDARAHEAARAQARRSKRHIDPKDRSAKAKIDLAIFTGQDGARGRLSSQMDARMQAAERRVGAAFVHKRYDGDPWVDAAPSPRKVVVRIAEARIPCGAGTLHIPELFVGNRDHIGIVGPNGAGKSTLLGHIRPRIARDLVVLDIPQELDPARRAQVLERVHDLSDAERGRALSMVAQLNSDPDRILDGGATSPGELRKLMLALGMLEHPALIIMDEPTNHLDLHSTEALERALAAYPGALLLVSHDRVFLDGCTTATWKVRDGAVTAR